jgi:hypothetical protein
MSFFLLNWLTNRSKIIFRRFAHDQSFLPLLVLTLALIGCDSNPKNEAKDLSRAREEVIKRVEAGSIIPDQNGVGQLPAELTTASKGGEIYVSKDPVAGFMIVFVLEASETNLMGNLYCQNEVPPNTSKIRIGTSDWIFRMKGDKHWAVVGKM